MLLLSKPEISTIISEETKKDMAVPETNMFQLWTIYIWNLQEFEDENEYKISAEIYSSVRFILCD